MADADIVRGLVKTSAGYVHYREAGNGPSILLLNASGQASSVSIELLTALRSRFRAIAIDYPSHGMSDHVAQPTIADYARWIIEVMDQLGIDKTALVSEATGNGVILELGRRYAERITKAIMVNCPYHADANSSRQAHESLKNDLRPTDASGFPLPRTIDFLLQHDSSHAPMRPTQSWMDRINVAQAESGRDRFQLLDAFGKYDLLRAFEEIKCPILLLMGEHFHYNKHLPEYRKRIADLRVEIIAGARFCAMWECADLIAGHAADFLRA